MLLSGKCQSVLTPSDCKASVSGLPVSKGYNQHQLGIFLNPSSPSGSGTMVSIGTSRPRGHIFSPCYLSQNFGVKFESFGSLNVCWSNEKILL